jgi:hypothetical protein
MRGQSDAVLTVAFLGPSTGSPWLPTIEARAKAVHQTQAARDADSPAVGLALRHIRHKRLQKIQHAGRRLTHVCRPRFAKTADSAPRFCEVFVASGAFQRTSPPVNRDRDPPTVGGLALHALRQQSRINQGKPLPE